MSNPQVFVPSAPTEPLDSFGGTFGDTSFDSAQFSTDLGETSFDMGAVGGQSGVGENGNQSDALAFFPSSFEDAEGGGSGPPGSHGSQSTPQFFGGKSDSTSMMGDTRIHGFGVESSLSQPAIPSLHDGNRKVNIWTGRFEDEEPLLEVLGINFGHIMRRTLLVQLFVYCNCYLVGYINRIRTEAEM